MNAFPFLTTRGESILSLKAWAEDMDRYQALLFLREIVPHGARYFCAVLLVRVIGDRWTVAASGSHFLDLASPVCSLFLGVLC